MRDIEALESAIDMLKLMFDTRHRDWYRHGHELSKLPEDDQIRGALETAREIASRRGAPDGFRPAAGSYACRAWRGVTLSALTLCGEGNGEGRADGCRLGADGRRDLTRYDRHRVN